MLSRILILTITTFVVGPMFALVHAQGTIQGEVYDAETEEPLPGATVEVPELNLGTTTDDQGFFYFEDLEPGSYEVAIGFVGYLEESYDVELDQGETVELEIILEEDVMGLDEVVVTGLGIREDADRTQASVGRVDADDITVDANIGEVSQLISGNIAGVSAQASSGNIGSGIRFNVRGGGGLGGDGQPVIYVDGTRIDNEEIGGFDAGGQGVSALAELNPDDIASVDVIRGPAGAAIYGTEGGNGVVLIETQRGDFFDDPTMNVQYSGTFGYQSQGRQYDEDLYGTADDANALFSDGPIRDHNLGVSGGAESYRYYAAVQNRQEEGMIPRTEGNRTSLRGNFEVFPTDDVNIQVNANYTHNNMHRPDNDNNVQGYLGNTLLNPVSYLNTDSTAINQMEDIQRVNRFVGSLSASWTPVENLTISATGGYDASSRRQDRTRPAGFAYSGIGVDGDRNIYNRINNQANFESQVQYDYRLSDRIQATSLVGGQFTDITRRINFGTSQGFGTDLLVGAGVAADITDFNESLLNTRRGGIFAQQQFRIDETYTLSALIRRDVASALGEGVSDVWYPSFNASAELSNLEVTPEIFTQLQPRVSYGETGELPSVADGIPLQFTGVAASGGSGGIISSIGRDDILPERIREVEAGIDIGIGDNFMLDATYWYNWADDSIIDVPLASSTGFGFQDLPQNVGSIESQGFESSLSFSPFVSEAARFDVDLTYSYQTNEVLDLGEDVDEFYDGFNRNVIKEGLPRQAFFLQEIKGPVFDDNDEVIVRPDGNIEIESSEERRKIGQPIPNHTGGLRLNLTMFQNLNLGAFAEYATGHQMYNSTAGFAALSGNYVPRNEAFDQLENAEPGTDEYIEAAETLAFTDPRDDAEANFVEDADWLKIRELTISYDFTDALISSGLESVNSFRVGVAASNILTLTSYDNPDPEVNFDGARSLSRGQDFLTLQTPQTFTLNVTLGF